MPPRQSQVSQTVPSSLTMSLSVARSNKFRIIQEWQRFGRLDYPRGARLILEFFLFFFGIFFVFWVSHVFSFFFWYFPFMLLDFPVNSDVFFTFVLFFLAVPCVSYFFGFCFFVLFLEEVWRWEESSLKIKKLEGGCGGGRSASPPDALGVVAFVRVAFLVLFFRFFPNSYVLCFLVLRVFLEERCGGERSHP